MADKHGRISPGGLRFFQPFGMRHTSDVGTWQAKSLLAPPHKAVGRGVFNSLPQRPRETTICSQQSCIYFAVIAAKQPHHGENVQNHSTNFSEVLDGYGPDQVVAAGGPRYTLRLQTSLSVVSLSRRSYRSPGDRQPALAMLYGVRNR